MFLWPCCRGLSQRICPPPMSAGGRNRGATGKPLLECSHPAHPSFLASCWPWGGGGGDLTGGDWLALPAPPAGTRDPDPRGIWNGNPALPAAQRGRHSRCLCLRIYAWVCTCTSVRGFQCRREPLKPARVLAGAGEAPWSGGFLKSHFLESNGFLPSLSYLSHSLYCLLACWHGQRLGSTALLILPVGVREQGLCPRLKTRGMPRTLRLPGAQDPAPSFVESQPPVPYTQAKVPHGGDFSPDSRERCVTWAGQSLHAWLCD